MVLLQRDDFSLCQGAADFCRFKHSTSSCLQFSSPSPVTNTSSQLRAVCARGVASLPAAAADSADAAPLVVALLATEDTPDGLAASPLRSEGTPLAVPPILMLPEAPIPASPALTVPTGASRSTLPGGTLGLV